MGDKKSRTLNANYAFNSQKQPKKPMGQGEFANMPQNMPLYTAYGQPESYRDGIVNAYTVNIQDVSELTENRRFNYPEQLKQEIVHKARYPGDVGDTPYDNA